MKNSKALAPGFHAHIASHAALFLSLLLLLPLITEAGVSAQTTPSEIPVTETRPITTTKAVERASEETAKARSVVRGRAVYDDTDRPVRRARILLLDMNQRGPERVGVTNSSGEFQIKEVPAGNYFVMVDATGIITPISFVDLEETNNENFSLAEVRKHFTEITVDGTNDQTIKVRARRGGAVSGKVTYADGDAAINVRVNIMRKKDGKLARFITNFNPSMLLGIQTDDRGMYRIAGLPPGEYNISAAESVDHADGRSGSDNDFMGMNMFGSSLLVTYYGGVTDIKEATSIQVEAGGEYNEINISLVERVLHTLSGTVVARRDNKPLPSARISVKSKNDALPDLTYMSMGPGVTADEQGRFTLNEIPDGVYTLTVEASYPDVETTTEGEEEGPPETTPSAPKRKLTRKQQDVTINGNDVSDLTITLTEGAIINGMVTVEGARQLPSQTYVMLADASGSSLVNEGMAEVQPDGKFTIDGLTAGAVYPNVLVTDTEDKYYVKAMTAGGADLMRDALVVGEGANINGVRIVVSPDAATLSGRVLAPDKTPVSGARMALIPADQTRWRARISYLFAESASNGGYTVSGAPGDYLIIFLRPADQPQAINETWIRDRAASAQRITLLPKQRKSLDITAPVQ